MLSSPGRCEPFPPVQTGAAGEDARFGGEGGSEVCPNASGSCCQPEMTSEVQQLFGAHSRHCPCGLLFCFRQRMMSALSAGVSGMCII